MPQMVERAMQGTTHRPGRARGTPRLWAEFVGFFLVVPVAVALFLPPDMMFRMLLAVTTLGVVLLHFTEGFRWHELGRGWSAVDWRVVAAMGAITAAVSLLAVMLTQPGALFALPRQMPGLFLMIVLLYPLLSALPQEIIFRPLFFRRYGRLMPSVRHGLVVNAAVFSLAHLLYWSWFVAAMTFAGGLVFAWAYEVRRSFPFAVMLHAVAGCVLFAVGMGLFFYTGNIDRPF